jgi:alginate O-acetyltransferase complex protein AlgI
MLFNSPEYALFLPLAVLLYWSFAYSVRAQNALLLVASYLFYGWWDWRFLGLLFVTSVIDYCVGLGIERADDKRTKRLILVWSLVANLGTLGFFKYYNFFVGSFTEAFASLGIELHAATLQVILPVGVSFYTFQALTYTVGVYRGTVKPTRDLMTFLSYVAFFPQLVAGPIERAQHMLPQFLSARTIDAARFASGLRQIAWGLFCKLAVADNCAIIVNAVFAQGETPAGSVALLGALFFAFQIYADFSGYTHIALGSARLLGFELMQNFATPYFSQSIGEFWKRWHISLSSWFRDYVYIPLGGSRVGKLRQARNILITFTISGLWHGANSTFIVWGFLHGLYYMPSIWLGEPLARWAATASAPVRHAVAAFRMLRTFLLVVVAWIFFRAESIDKALAFVKAIFSPSLFTSPAPVLQRLDMGWSAAIAAFAIAALLAIEWVQRDKKFALEVEGKPAAYRWLAYACVVGLVVSIRYTGSALDFIYFQF